MSKGFKIEGMGRLQANLLRAAAMTRVSAAEAVRQEVEAVRKDAESGAPRRSGELRANISGDSIGSSGAVRSTARHAGFVEFGTFKDAAQPYMAPAAERSRRRFVGRVSAVVKSALEGIR